MIAAIAVMTGFVACTGIWLFRVRRRRDAYRRHLGQIAERYQLELTRGDAATRIKAEGDLDDVWIHVDTVKRGQRWCTRVVARAEIPTDVIILPSGTGEVIGDPLFDARTLTSGPMHTLRALLDQSTRTMLIDALQLKVEVGKGAVQWSSRGLADANELGRIIDQMRGIARALSRPVDDAALAKIVRSDVLDVALGAFESMSDGAPKTKVSREIAGVRNDALGFAAGLEVGDVKAVAHVLANLSNPLQLRAEALTWLGVHTDASAFAISCLAEPPLTPLALRVLVDGETQIPLATLTDLLARARQSESVELLARALQLHGAMAEPLLIKLLGSADVVAARSAAEALALVGTKAAIVPLRARLGGLSDWTVQPAVTAAIAAIQSRLGGESGGLSIADDAAGRLSEPE